MLVTSTGKKLRTGNCLEHRAQGSLEFLLLLGAILGVAGLLVAMVSLSAQGLSSSVGGQIENVRDNSIMPGLVGLIFGAKRAFAPEPHAYQTARE